MNELSFVHALLEEWHESNPHFLCIGIGQD